MTRFVYVLPAGRFRWEVRVEDAEFIEDVAEALYRRTFKDMRGWNYADPPENWMQQARAAIRAAMPGNSHSQLYRRKAHALIAARAIALLIGGEVQPHDRRGRIQDPDSYGNDPRESAG